MRKVRGFFFQSCHRVREAVAWWICYDSAGSQSKLFGIMNISTLIGEPLKNDEMRRAGLEENRRRQCYSSRFSEISSVQAFVHYYGCMSSTKVKLVIFVPLAHADTVRQVLGEAGAGKIGNYDFCSFSSRGIGRFRGDEKTHPAIGEAGNHETVEEERIEVILPREILKEVVEKVKSVHPYEEMAFDIYPLERAS